MPRVLEHAADPLEQSQVEPARERVLRGARDHDGDHVGAAARQAARERIRRIAEPAGDLLRPSARVATEMRGSPARARDTVDCGHIGGPRHVAQGDRGASDAHAGASCGLAGWWRGP